jgi:hypothetical protein
MEMLSLKVTIALLWKMLPDDGKFKKYVATKVLLNN